MNIGEKITEFIKQSERVVAVTHKPRGPEYTQMAFITALGITIIGMIGFVINIGAHYLR
ncbi:protein translocase SEC61 complex subunit gamma [Candidatus Micrarchaeota archaeon]|nr:protein translocase SEC61 complex subunit gamma [Candidatus Micrarchaeota archaeon]